MSGTPALNRRSQLSWAAILACLAIEAFLLIWVVFVTLNVAISSTVNVPQNFSLVAVSAICLAWVVITLLGSVRSKASWVRGSAVTIHVLLFAAGTGCLQLKIGPTVLGLGLIVLALIGFFAAVTAKPELSPESSGYGDPDTKAEDPGRAA